MIKCGVEFNTFEPLPQGYEYKYAQQALVTRRSKSIYNPGRFTCCGDKIGCAQFECIARRTNPLTHPSKSLDLDLGESLIAYKNVFHSPSVVQNMRQDCVLAQRLLRVEVRG